MTREQYLRYRTNNDIVTILYRHFVKYAILKLSVKEFVKYFNIWKGNEQGVNEIIDYYDKHFNIVIVTLENQYIKFY